MRILKDTDGKASWTVTLGVPAVIILTLRWLVAGVDVTYPGGHVSVSAWTGGDYAMAVGVWLGFLAQKGWRDRAANGNGNGAASPKVVGG